MNSKKQKCFKLGVAATIFMGVLSVVMAISSNAQAKQGGQVLTLNLKGVGPGYEAEVPMIDGTGTTTATCFDVGLYNLDNGLQIGTATDCLSDITPVGDGLKLVGTTYFNFTGGAQLITRGNTTVQPILHDQINFSHTTGAEPSGGNDILSGSKQFSKAKGSVRLSGLVNLDVADEITFDCIFVINLK